MSAWKEWQLAMASDDVSEEECEERRREWERECREEKMRWIDADALGCDTEWSEYHDGFISYSQMEINTTPTIDAVEVVHGEWIDKGWKGDWQFETDGRGNCWHEYECSECGFRNKGSKSNYCPNCGAKMKGADDE